MAEPNVMYFVAIVFIFATLMTSIYSFGNIPNSDKRFHYAGFWVRLVAALIDGIVIAIVAVIILASFNYLVLASTSDINVQREFLGLSALLSRATVFVFSWLYSASMESSVHQATLGKQALGLRIVDLSGRRIGFGQASGRHFGKIISSVILFMGFIMIGWTRQKQGLHDKMSGCLVIRYPSEKYSVGESDTREPLRRSAPQPNFLEASEANLQEESIEVVGNRPLKIIDAPSSSQEVTSALSVDLPQNHSSASFGDFEERAQIVLEYSAEARSAYKTLDKMPELARRRFRERVALGQINDIPKIVQSSILDALGDESITWNSKLENALFALGNWGELAMQEFFRVFPTLSKSMPADEIVDAVVTKLAGRVVRDFIVPDYLGNSIACTYHSNGTLRIAKSGKVFGELQHLYNHLRTPLEQRKREIYFVD